MTDLHRRSGPNHRPVHLADTIPEPGLLRLLRELGQSTLFARQT